ncbi:MAG: FAD-binding protein [Clostridia bacterium]|nr:FAD-binding protein [Clostridia bacterium]
MKIVVCIRQGLDGEINPFDACAYEEALKIGGEITLLSMGPLTARDFLLRLTRLGAKKAILLSDKAFAGADTLATAYTLSLAIKKIKPDYIFCGRQTLVGDTAQTGPMLSVYAKTNIITNVMGILAANESEITCKTRDFGEITTKSPTLLTVERINNLRLPSIRSKMGEVEVWTANDINADLNRCGLKGSPTRVLETKENSSGRRRCKYITADELSTVISESLKKNTEKVVENTTDGEKLKKVFCVGQAPLEYAKAVCDKPTVIPLDNSEKMAEYIKTEKPDAVIWGSDGLSKQTSAQVAAMLNLGLCADCTSLQTDGEILYMVRPALAGSVVAKIKSVTTPAMATVRTTQKDTADVLVGIGFGARENIEKIKAFAEKMGGDITATRKMVDYDYLPYNLQVGLTGKTVAPAVYIAVGISGAVHHIVGMQRAGTVIAVNPDKDAPIFDYADYGIIANTEDVFNSYNKP